MKLTILGGAGVRTVFFTNGVAQKAAVMGIKKLVLFDIDEKKLNIIGSLAKYAAKKTNPALEIILTTDAKEAISGTDYIVTTIRVGFDKSRAIDEDIAIKHGSLGQETTGIGGFSMALRTIPVMREYLQMVKEFAPNAIVFNFTNPSGLVSQGLRDVGFDNVLGICDAPSSTKIAIAKALSVPTSSLNVQFTGLNHLSFVTSVRLEGKEILPELLQDDEFLGSVKEFSMFEPDLIRAIGHLPNEYLYYFYYRNKACKNVASSEKARGKAVLDNNIEMFAALEKIFDVALANAEKNGYIEDIAEDVMEELLQTYLRYMYKRESTYMANETSQNLKHKAFDGKIPDAEGYAGVMMNYLLAMSTGEEREMVLSIPSKTPHFGLEANDVMEITCQISKNGIAIQEAGELSPIAKSLITAVKVYENLTIEAINKKSKQIAHAALMAHPLIGDYQLAKDLLEDILEAHKEYLGEWR